MLCSDDNATVLLYQALKALNNSNGPSIESILSQRPCRQQERAGEADLVVGTAAAVLGLWCKNRGENKNL